MGDVLVVLDRREQVVHARREPGDRDLPELLRLEPLLAGGEDRLHLLGVPPERLKDLVVHRERQFALDLSLDRIPQDPQGPLAGEPHAATVHDLVDQLPLLLPHRARVLQEVREVDPETSVPAVEVEPELPRQGSDEGGVLDRQSHLGPHRLRERVPADQVGVGDRGDEHPRNGVRKDLREDLRVGPERRFLEGRPIALLQGNEDAVEAASASASVRGLLQEVGEGDPSVSQEP